MPTLLIVDDEPLIPMAIRPGFRNMGAEVVTARTAADGLDAVATCRPDAILLDIGLPDLSGLQLFQRIRAEDVRIPVIIMTGQGTTATAIEAMKLGAYDYILKPFSFGQIRDVVLTAFEIGRSMRVPVTLQHGPAESAGEADALVGRGPAMQTVYKMIGRVAPQEGIVLIRGESGTGKELVARAIYQHSRRSAETFLAINIAAIPETLLESELFGHERGAFTGAERKRIGKFEQCDGGTLFLDEIGDMPMLTQVKILRVLQDQQFERLGGTESIRTDVRIIAATNRPLEAMVASDKFREDLYYRLNIFPIVLPPLRERTEDLPHLIRHFLGRFSREMGREIYEASPETLDALRRYSWPGNLRELQSVLRQALLHGVGPLLLPEFLPDSIRRPTRELTRPKRDVACDANEWDKYLDERLEAGTSNLYTEWFSRMERHVITRVLQHTHGNQLRAAVVLGITRRSLRNKIRTLGITIERSVSSDENPESDSPGDEDPKPADAPRSWTGENQ